MPTGRHDSSNPLPPATVSDDGTPHEFTINATTTNGTDWHLPISGFVVGDLGWGNDAERNCAIEVDVLDPATGLWDRVRAMADLDDPEVPTEDQDVDLSKYATGPVDDQTVTARIAFGSGALTYDTNDTTHGFPVGFGTYPGAESNDWFPHGTVHVTGAADAPKCVDLSPSTSDVGPPTVLGTLTGRDSTGTLWSYSGDRDEVSLLPRRAYGLSVAGGTLARIALDQPNETGVLDDAPNGDLTYLGPLPGSTARSKLVGTGWNRYDLLVSPGDIGGASGADLIERDGQGVLWESLGYGNGTFTAPARIGGGWGGYTSIVAGDFTGDGHPDLVARDASGGLWFYRGTGNYKAPFAARTLIGHGWNTYNELF